VDGGFLDEAGKDDTKLSSAPDAVVADVVKVRAQIGASKFPGLRLFITEWSTSYTARDPVHDSYISAPYILSKLKGSQGLAQAMSYWTYSDLFEEGGPPPTPFHGGFGLLNREGIRKPAFFAYKYLHALRGHSIATADEKALAARDGGHIAALVWDWQQPKQALSNRPFYTRVLSATPSAPVRVRVQHLAPGAYRVQLHRTGFRRNDPQTAYLEMQSPVRLSAPQLAQLQALTRDLPERNQIVTVAANGRFTINLPMRSNDVTLLTLDRVAARR
jgi:xylan 1,4-beta-xylosidase